MRRPGTSSRRPSVYPGVSHVDAGALPRLGLLRRSTGLTPWTRATEAVLVRAARNGSEDAVAELFDRHWHRLHRAAILITGDRTAAEDIAQESFLAAVRALDRFDLRRPLGPWLHRIVVNRSIDFSRARALRREVGEPSPQTAGANAPREPEDRLAAALMALGPEQRAAVVLRYLLDLTPGEISRALDVPRGTVNSRISRGLDSLGGMLEEEEKRP